MEGACSSSTLFHDQSNRDMSSASDMPLIPSNSSTSFEELIAALRSPPSTPPPEALNASAENATEENVPKEINLMDDENEIFENQSSAGSMQNNDIEIQPVILSIDVDENAMGDSARTGLRVYDSTIEMTGNDLM